MAVTVRDMLEAGAHYGHQTRRWNPKMRQYIYGARNGIYIINLGKTAKLLKDATNFLSRLVARGEQVLFVATKKQARDIVKEEAIRCRQPVVAYRWLGGTLTNFKTIKTSIERLNEIERSLSPEMAHRLPKKEQARLAKSREKLLRNLGGLRNMPGMPGAVFVVDPVEEHIAVAEANRLKIPVVAVCDTNANPDVVDYVIPANDDAMRSIRLFVQAAADACLAGVAAGRSEVAVFGEGSGTNPASENVEVIRKPRHVEVADEVEAGGEPAGA
ncbi:MAG: 30S ribosomal protein S2 [Myxococcales bacterium]|nr:30S ribosomal protein S2 [Myxococcales bacterium]